jgi:hypothetical protein
LSKKIFKKLEHLPLIYLDVWQFFGGLYGTGVNVLTCLSLAASGNVQRCNGANVLCEKTLFQVTSVPAVAFPRKNVF